MIRPRPLHISAFERVSETSGPGSRAVLWLRSPGRPGAAPAGHGFRVTVDETFAHIAALGDRIEGVTVRGDEPLRQRRAVLRLLARVREETSLSVILLTGYGWDEIVRMPGATALRDRVDVLLAGRPPEHGAHGSPARTMHLFTARYSAADLDAV
ncbi:4Fe-4S cluster-binding domain-containing protein [Actinomadura sp. 3N407]|uniref:4Fe-4S cluster-binding domain-containing protein n=1 Tax=Actinomadura sp. 3N407 TaxID=3457423 RepID=UPI003FCC6985